MVQDHFSRGSTRMLGCLSLSIALSSCGFLTNEDSASSAVAIDALGKASASKAAATDVASPAAATAPEAGATPTALAAADSTSLFSTLTDAIIGTTISSPAPSPTPPAATTVAKTSGDPLATANWLDVRSASGKDELNVPFQFGRPFAVGEVKTCPQIRAGGKLLPSQADVKTRHPDGSVRFAVLSLILDKVSAVSSTRLELVEGEGCGQVAASKASMLAMGGGFEARISASGQAASARTMLSAGDYKTWTAGPVVTTLILADHRTKKYDIGAGNTKVVRPSFEVQFWPALDQYRVRYVGETSDTEKVGNDTHDLSLNMGISNSTVYSKAAFAMNHSSRWTKVFWSGSAAPAELNVNWNVAYLASTKALPNYDASISLSSAAESKLVSDWQSTPKDLQDPGMWQRYMPQTGGRADLGPFPKWSIAWLYSGSAQTKAVALGNADLAGAWPMHLREGSASKRLTRAQNGDLAAGMPVSFYARPTLARPGCNGYDWSATIAADKVTQVGTTSDGGWYPDTAHQPQPFFIPYLLTGEHFYLEQMQFWAGFSAQVCGPFGTAVPSMAASGSCWARSVNYTYAGRDNQIRGQAWALRQIAEAAWSTPNTPDDPRNSALGADLATAAEDKIVFEEGLRGIVRASNNTRPDWQWARSGAGDCNAGIRSGMATLRYWDQTSPYPASATYAKAEAGWQLGFVMYALTRATELGAPAGSLRSWLAPYFIGQVTAPGANPYRLADYITPVVTLQGNAFQSWADVDAAGNQPFNGPNMWATDGSVTSLDQGYGSTAMAAIASSYGESGANLAWSNFALGYFQKWGWQNDPKWALIPRP